MKLQFRRALGRLCALIVCAAILPVAGLGRGSEGRIRGVVYDAQSGSVLRDATVEVVEANTTARTGATGPGHCERAHALGYDAILAKPFRPRAFADAVARLARRL